MGRAARLKSLRGRLRRAKAGVLEGKEGREREEALAAFSRTEEFRGLAAEHVRLRHRRFWRDMGGR